MLSQESPTWYSDAKQYWDNIESSVEGMLGGYGRLTAIDALGSNKFIKEFLENKRLNNHRACDCGAGIGRVSEVFLLKNFQTVDLVEQTEKFLVKAKELFVEKGLDDRVEQYIPTGLQNFNPEAGRYDLIWCQWVLSHLTDDDLVVFLKRCKDSLNGGYIEIKENVAEAGIIYDDEDS
ncbi:hypothetical protein HDV02_000582, partial [Globomyces sp. JEL0801]